MPTKRRQRDKFKTQHFVLTFWGATLLLLALRCFFPAITGGRAGAVAAKEEAGKDKVAAVQTPAPKSHHKAPDNDGRPLASASPDSVFVIPDSIVDAAANVDKLFFGPRPHTALTDADGKPFPRKLRKITYDSVFSAINDVHLITALSIGQPLCEDRSEAASNLDRYVYVGASPFYDVEKLTYSVPYLVPRAAVLLDEIGRNFLDSLTARGIPFHKMVLTSLLRTNDDVARLKRRNRNASDNSCHRFGTTFDIAYSTFYRVKDPDGPKQQEWSAKELMPILAEVLEDQQRLGTCYVRYETHEQCFHITCR